jgi:hypothetical protein
MGSNATKAVGHRDSDRNLRQIHPSKTGSHRSAKDAFALLSKMTHPNERDALCVVGVCRFRDRRGVHRRGGGEAS